MNSKLHLVLQMQSDERRGQFTSLSYALAHTALGAAGLHCCTSTLPILVNVLFLHQLRNTLSVAKVFVLDLFTVWLDLLNEDGIYQYSREVGCASEEVGG